MTKRHLILRFDAPLMAFGSVMIDQHGPVQDFPAASMLTGLLGNALGLRRTETGTLQRLQDRLVHAVRLDRRGERLRDYQTLDLFADDSGWTTHGKPEGRNRDSPSFKVDQAHLRRTGESRKRQTHERYRHFNADAVVTIALRLEPADETPTLDDLAEALDHPVRPLFLGRKPCLPAGRLRLAPPDDRLDAPTALQAVREAAAPGNLAEVAPDRLFWPEGEGPETDDRRDHTGRRVWRTDLHGGRERWFAETPAGLDRRTAP